MRMIYITFVQIILAVCPDSSESSKILTEFFVSGGQTTAPFYDFKDSDGKTIDFDEFKLIAGQTYVFMASDINASHPFKISDQNGTETLFSNEYITYSSGSELVGSDANVTIAIPSEYNSTLYFFCAIHPGMSKRFSIQQDINRISVSGGQTTAPFYDFADSGGGTIHFREFNLIAGQTYDFIASGIIADHPFMISDQNGSLSSSISIGGPLWGDKNTSDFDNDDVSNFTEWLKGSNPTRQDSDLDTLPDLEEFNFGSNLIKVDTDNDGANDAVEFSQDSNPRKPDSDGDGLLDGNDDSPKDAVGVGVISGRIFILDKYDDNISAKPFYRFAESTKTSDWNATKGGWLLAVINGGADRPFSIKTAFSMRKNYTIQVYLEIKDTQEDSSPHYDEGEPFIEHNVSFKNKQNVYGINLQPRDPAPKIQINPEFKVLSIEINSTKTTEVVSWNNEINATDPYYSNPWTMDSNLNDGRGFILEETLLNI